MPMLWNDNAALQGNHRKLPALVVLFPMFIQLPGDVEGY